METDHSSPPANESPKIVSCIINPAARDGHSLKIWETAKNKFENEGLKTELHLTEKVGHASEIAYSLKDR